VLAVATAHALGLALLWGWLAAEGAFALYYYGHWLPHLSHKGVRAHRDDQHDIAVTQSCLLSQLKRVDDLPNTLRSWFLDAKPSDVVRRDNVRELFAYAVWYRTM
jgi:hypothetical protein